MTDVRWTAKRHELLREIGAGKLDLYVGLQWNLIRRPDQWLSGTEKRTANSVRFLVTQRTPSFRLGVKQLAILTAAGRALLADWDVQHPTEEPTP